MATQSVRDISWVVFDLGGVIIRIHHSWQEAAAVAKVECHSDPALDPTKHRAAEFKKLVSEHQRGILSHDIFCEGVSELTANLLSARDVARIHQSVIVGAYEGVEQLVLDLKQRGIYTA